MNLAADILNQRDAGLLDQSAEAASYNYTVPLDEARRRVVTDNYGEITRRKTNDKNVVELLAGGKVIGCAEAFYKTKTQRTWTLYIGDSVLSNQHTISKGIRAFSEEATLAEVTAEGPTKAKVLAGPTATAKKVKANA